MNRHDRKVWAACESFDDLCDATVRWLHGEVRETPGHMGPPCDETAEITADLVALNEAGFLTTGSQPGMDPVWGYNGRRWHQRAFLEGYCDAATAAKVAGACREVGLECHDENVTDMPWRAVAWVRRRGRARTHTPVTATAHGLTIATAVPHRMDRPDHDIQFEGVGDGAWDAVEQSVRVTVVDLHWGASRLLWNTLVAALTKDGAAA